MSSDANSPTGRRFRLDVQRILPETQNRLGAVVFEAKDAQGSRVESQQVCAARWNGLVQTWENVFP
jgi:hypothetical protein